MSVDVVCVASFNADLVSRVARPLARGETVLASGFDIQPGGKGSNAAIACARQGARVAVLARLGDDDFGRMALRITIDDPKAYAKPWSVDWQLALLPDTELIEDICENEKDVQHMQKR